MIQNVQDSMFSTPRVKLTFQLGSEAFSVDSKTGNLSQQLAALKEESMNILKEYITKQNVANDVPDESIEAFSEEDEEEEEEQEEEEEEKEEGEDKNPPKKSKKSSIGARGFSLASLINLPLQSFASKSVLEATKSPTER